MSRLIDADALDAAFTDLRFNADGTLAHWGDRPDWCLQGREVEKLIHDAPTIDAVPVVRCRECKHYREAPSQTSDNAVVVWCAADKYPHNDVMPDDWYCAAGEREEADHE